MSNHDRDTGLDTLLDLDGQILIIDPLGNYWVKFVVKRVPASPEKPHGLSYSLTLHDERGERLVGFDNAHPVRQSRGPAGRRRKEQDHMHRILSIRPYDYENAAALLADFWAEVDRVLKQRER